MSTAPMETIPRCIVYPSIPVHKKALAYLHVIVDLDKRLVYRAFGRLTSVIEASLYEAANVVLSRVSYGGRPIYTIDRVDSMAPIVIEVDRLADVLELRELEKYVNRIASTSYKRDAFMYLTARGYLLYYILVNVNELLGEARARSLDIPPVIHVDGFFLTHPLALGILKNIRVKAGVVPVLVGEKAVGLSVEELRGAILYYMDVLPYVMSSANELVKTVVKAMEEARVREVLAKLPIEKVFEAFGVGLAAAAEARMEESRAGEVAGAAGVQGGAAGVKISDEAVRKAAEAMAAFLEDVAES